MGKMFSNNINVDYLNNTVDIPQHNLSTQGLKLAGTLVTSSAAELNILDGVTATAAEINAAATNSTRIVNCTAATLAVTLAAHDKKIVTLNRATGVAVTLPAAAGTGAVYTFLIMTATAGGSTTIKVANSSDNINGLAFVISDDAGAPMKGYAAAATDDTITFNGTTTGGLLGDMVIVRDVAANYFHVEVRSHATSTEATPFSATV